MKQKPTTEIITWLIAICGLVCLIVLIGGLTRLTNSGLSMVDWRPLMGILPPLSTQDWQFAFDAYKLFPEYQKYNVGMNLSEFKTIFLWEYSHRLLARSVGILFFIPWAYFLFKKKLSKSFAIKTLIGFSLGGLQGLIGWYMVKSGLVKDPHVSHLRLALHLCLAFFIYSYFLWLIFDLKYIQSKKHNLKNYSQLFYFSLFILSLVVLQIIYGAFTAGLKAGYIYNTFPKMGDLWIASDWNKMQPWLINFIYNPVTVQFVHRVIPWILLTSSLGLIYYLNSSDQDKALIFRSKLLLMTLSFQILVGIFNLIYAVPVAVASLHQIGALAVLSVSVSLLHWIYQNRLSKNY